MSLNDPQEVFILFFAIYFGLMVDRSHEMYKPWDTYNAWKGKSHNIKRLLTAWLILFLIPISHFGILFILLGSVNIRFDATFAGVSRLILISLGSFFEFGYFRIYESFLHSYPESFFGDEERAQFVQSGKIRPDFWGHFMPGALYVLVSTLMVVIAIYL
jgi:hypothetical protein